MRRIGQPHRNDFDSRQAAIYGVPYMYTQSTTRQQSKQAPIVFMRRDDPEPSAIFVAGECICKACKSPDLSYYAYLNDAKCGSCRQYQNEPLLAS